MKISVEEVSRVLAFSIGERSNTQAAASSPTQTGTSQSQDAAQVEVSSQAQQIQQVKKLIDQQPDVRTDRVQALKAQIENGTYNVPGEDIADLIIRRTLADNTAL